MTKIMIAAPIVLILSVSTALAQGDRQRLTFADLDANGDGEISESEMNAHRTARFTSADTNGDGLLSKDEMLARADEKREDRVNKMIERLDANGDGLLSQDEMTSRADDRRAGRFARLDTDNSGGLSMEELANSRLGRAGKHRK